MNDQTTLSAEQTTNDQKPGAASAASRGSAARWVCRYERDDRWPHSQYYAIYDDAGAFVFRHVDQRIAVECALVHAACRRISVKIVQGS